MTRSRRKIDRDFSSINVENTYNVHALYAHKLLAYHWNKRFADSIAVTSPLTSRARFS